MTVEIIPEDISLGDFGESIISINFHLGSADNCKMKKSNTFNIGDENRGGRTPTCLN